MSPGKRAPRNISDVPPDSLGGQIRRLRMDAGMSQEELGEAIGADQARISAYERGRFRPTEDILIQIAQALGVKPGLLLEQSIWGGALPIGSALRDGLRALDERELGMVEATVRVLGDVPDEKRDQFQRGLAAYLESWHGS